MQNIIGERRHFADFAPQIWANGYSVIPLQPRLKKPQLVETWRSACWERTSENDVRDLAAAYPDRGVGIACGRHTMAFDLDVDNEATIAVLRSIVEDICGVTQLVRVGRSPRIMLIYRAIEPILSIRLPKIDILGMGTQFAAYGVHPTTDADYLWIGETAPHLTPLEEITGVTNAQCEAVAAAICRAVCGARFKRMVFDIDLDLVRLNFTSRSHLFRQLLSSLLRGKARARREVETMVINHEIPPGYWGFVMRPEVEGGFDHRDFMERLNRGEFVEGLDRGAPAASDAPAAVSQ
ncbi:bifunctional DNA primase/polymerase [Pseudohoeflea coraliihabitans]|uniref:Bifunctional DNA primase/polymerase n=1 Tax=Pseudohoeflea coraliihabitans TaxID=2860393 RepID=A0ABS6WSA5_9HYPH|nr:bifunctional DNA primase/polymerase [Pseudohoeflea sp. DP4N28-3]MBW3098307.1 bifunctional DNA primase/polymerase [Pseudohoeflea sp. DP4N28-3]